MPGEITKHDTLLAWRIMRRSCGHIPDDAGRDCEECDNKIECDSSIPEAAQLIADDRAEERRVHAAVVAVLEELLARRATECPKT